MRLVLEFPRQKNKQCFHQLHDQYLGAARNKWNGTVISWLKRGKRDRRGNGSFIKTDYFLHRSFVKPPIAI
jgi:hypothetical protein